MSLKTICILAGILAVLYGVYFFWVAFKYRSDEDNDQIEPSNPQPTKRDDDQ